MLAVRADSTAWATQLRLMSSSILGRLEAEVGKGAVTELKVVGPGRAELEPGRAGPGPRPARHLRLTGRAAGQARRNAVREPLGTPGA